MSRALEGPPQLLQPALVVDGDGVALPPGTMVRIERGQVVAVDNRSTIDGGDVRIVELPGATLLPGFIDLHAYLSIDPDLPDPMRQMHSPDLGQRRRVALRHMERDLAAGVTTMRVMGEGGGLDIALRDAVARGDATGPAILASSVPVCASTSHQAAPGGGADTPEAIRALVRANADIGVDWIKLVATGGVNAPGDGGRRALYARGQLLAAADAARELGLPVAVAAHGGSAIRDAIDVGAASLEHCALLDDREIELLVRSRVMPVLTLTRFFAADGIALSAAASPVILARLEEARARVAALVRALARAGKPFGLGSDNMHGRFGEEAATAVSLGASPASAVAAMTGHAAKLLRKEDRIGAIRAGAAADLVAIRGDPLRDISALTRIVGVWRAGRPVASPLASANPT